MIGKDYIRRTRAIVLVLLGATALVTLGGYLYQRQRRTESTTRLPERIPSNITQSEGFSLSKSEQGRTLFTVRAARVREQRDTGKTFLEEVEIITYGAQGNRHDRILSKLCEYDAKNGVISSEGDVEIELATMPKELAEGKGEHRGLVPAADDPHQGPSVFVQTSGVTFLEKTGVASTERPVMFRFARGQGKAMGAVYDSAQRTLQLKADVEIDAAESALAAGWIQTGKDVPSAFPIRVTASEMVHHQGPNHMRLKAVRLQREVEGGGRREMSAAEARLELDAENQLKVMNLLGNAQVRSVVGGKEARESTLNTDRLEVLFTKEQDVERAYGHGSVRAVSRSTASRLEATAARLEMYFGPASELKQLEWRGGVRMSMDPAERGAATRVLTSQDVEMFMQPGGRNIGDMRTLAPGRLELAPDMTRPPAQRDPRRVLTAGLIHMNFAESGGLRNLRAEKDVRLESEVVARPAAGAGRAGEQRGGGAGRPAGQRVTTSRALLAVFTPDSDELRTVEQSGDFRYTDGEQSASAETALYTAATEEVRLSGRPGQNPEVWDARTRTSAQQITLNQKTNEGVALREVRSMHQPGEKEADGPGPLSGREPVHVIAERMETNSKSGVTRYEGAAGGRRARMWQNQDVIEAPVIVLEREARRLTAEGGVTTLLSDSGGGARGTEGGTEKRKSENTPSTVNVTAQRMVYTDADRRAHYEKSVVLRRRQQTMRAAALDAYLLEASAVKAGQSRLERAVARGAVEIVDAGSGASRRASAEMAEYFGAEEKVVLSGGQPYVFDAQRGYTRGRQLTYFLRDDTIFVHGDGTSRTVTEQRVTSRAPGSGPGR